MSFKRMMRNARRAMNYNLPAQLPGTAGATVTPLEPYSDGVEKTTKVYPEDFDIDMMVKNIAEDIDGNEA